jgi:hypothetical protein
MAVVSPCCMMYINGRNSLVLYINRGFINTNRITPSRYDHYRVGCIRATLNNTKKLNQMFN